MASSSDWIAALTEQPAEVGSAKDTSSALDWMHSINGARMFVEGAPFARHHAVLQAAAPSDAGEGPPDEAVQEREAPIEQTPAPDPIAEAEARGEAAGRAAADAEWQAKLNEQRALRLTFQAFDKAAMDSFAAQLAETVMALCSAAIADFEADPESLAVRCAEAAKRLGSAASEFSLHLNPDDLSLIDPASLEDWNVVADTNVERSGLRFESAEGAVSDGPKEWRRAIAAAIKG